MSFESVLRCHQDINALARSLLGRAAFDDLHVMHPDPDRPEPAFIRATSWLYCLYFEAGRVSITFLRRLGEAYALLDRAVSDQHVETVRCLRTELHHNLGFEDSDQAARTAAESWRKVACGTALPKTDPQWAACYQRLLSGACDFLDGLDVVVRRVEADGPLAQQHIEEWKRRLNRDWPAAAFDRVIDDAKYRLSREALNTVAFRNRHLAQWRRQLEVLDDGFDFTFEATRLVEKALLNDDTVLIPITGRDLIETLGIKPGPQVGTFLAEARRHFEVTRCTKDELLDHLRKKMVAGCVPSAPTAPIQRSRT